MQDSFHPECITPGFKPFSKKHMLVIVIEIGIMSIMRIKP